MLLLIVKSREATFLVISMMADKKLRERDMGGFSDNPYSPVP